MHDDHHNSAPSEWERGGDEVPVDHAKIEALIQEFSSGNGMVRRRARDTLALLGPPAVPALVQLLTDEHMQIRWEAAKALGEIRHPSAIPGLIDSLEDPASEVRWLAATALINIGYESVIPVLKTLTSGPAVSKTLRQRVRHVLNDLGSRNSVLGEIIVPAIEVLGDTDPASLIPPAALSALDDLWRLRY